MTIDKNDPRLTAFALGELAAEETAELAAAVEKDPSLQADVAAIREMAEKLKTTLAAEPLPTADPPRPLKSGRRKYLLALSTVTVTILLLVAAFIIPSFQSSKKSAHLFMVRESCIEPSPAGSFAASAKCPEAISNQKLRLAQPQDAPIADIKYSGEKKNQHVVGQEVTVVKPDQKYWGHWPKTSPSPYSPAQPQTPQANQETQTGRFMIGVGVNSESGLAGSITLDENNYKPGVSMGRESTSMRMMVNPRIIIAEEEEEVIGRTDDMSIRLQSAPFNTESYDKITENEFQRVSDHPLSTFSIDVDTAGYSMVRRMLLEQARMPVPGAVRLEEMINYFDYEYEPPTDDRPFATHVDAARCPWNEEHNLLRIGLKGRVIDKKERDAANLVFLLDVSGSMNEPNKLPLLKESMKMLVENLNEKDRVAIVVYAGASGLVLPSTGCGDRQKIIDALDRLQAGGSTNGGAGITLAYATAAANYIRGGTNRVILCTDGDFNVGTTNQSELVEIIEKKAKEGVFLTVLGFGMGNFKDSTLEKLADRGNGNYGYVDTPGEARKLLVEGLSGTLVAIAKDVKIQVEFNPAQVKAYRLLGYENRMLKKEDFNDDTKDAGEIGAGHTVTALYEIIPADSTEELVTPKVDALKYQTPSPVSGSEVHDSAASPHSQEMLTVKLRYKEPDGEKSKLLEFPYKNDVTPFDEANDDLRFASSAAAFGMLLRGSAFKGNADYDKVLAWAENSLGKDEFGYRNEFLKLVRAAKSLSNK